MATQMDSDPVLSLIVLAASRDPAQEVALRLRLGSLDQPSRPSRRAIARLTCLSNSTLRRAEQRAIALDQAVRARVGRGVLPDRIVHTLRGASAI